MRNIHPPRDPETLGKVVAGFVVMFFASCIFAGFLLGCAGCKPAPKPTTSTTAKNAAVDHLATTAARGASGDVYAPIEQAGEAYDWRDFVYAPKTDTPADPRTIPAIPPAKVETCEPGSKCYQQSQQFTPRRRWFKWGR